MNDQSPFLRFTPQQLDEIRSRVTVSSIVGQRVKLVKSGREFSGLCPFHNERTPSFTVSDEKGFWHCFGCGAHGDVIRWMTEYENIPFVDAVRQLAADGQVQLAGEPATAREMLNKVKPDAGPSSYVTSDVVGAWGWKTASPALGELPEAWLDWRGFDPALPLVRRALQRMKFHPAMPFFPWKTWERGEQVVRTWPAMLLPVEIITGPRGNRKRRMIGVHATYLRGDGKGKAALPINRRTGSPYPARKIWGELAGGAVWLSGVDGIDGPVGAHEMRVPLMVGEGFESTLSAMIDQPREMRGAAALSLNNLQGRMRKSPAGAIRMFNIEPETDHGGFVLEDPGAVMIAVDADMKVLRTVRDGELIGPKVQDRRGGPVTIREISGAERASICAALAVKNWRSAGGYPVTAIRPRAGCDFNDQLAGTR